MLVLERRFQETIHIGDDIIVTVVAIKGDKVRLGIDAPKEMTVDRSEVRESKRTSPRPVLISERDELLAACKAIIEARELEYSTRTENWFNNEVFEAYGHAFDLALIATAKAKGGAK